MSQSKLEVLDEPSVVTTLRPGPGDTVRITYEYPRFDAASSFLEGFRLQGRTAYACLSPVIEVDRAKLMQLKFTQQELAEIGFSLVMRLAGALRWSGATLDA
jgi:hypothetical protein